MRKTLSPSESLTEFLSFEDAPPRAKLGDIVTLFLDELFYKTPPADADPARGLRLEGGLAVSFGDPRANPCEFGIGLIDTDIIRLSIARPLTGNAEQGDGAAEVDGATDVVVPPFLDHSELEKPRF